MQTKTITIRNASIADKNYIDDLAISLNCSIPEALSYIVAKAKEKINNTPAPADDTILNDLKAEAIKKDEIIQQLTNENEALKNKALEIKEVEKEVIKQVPIELTGSQFICELTPEVANAARKLRKFIREDGHVSMDGNYPNELANISVKHFIKRNYSDLVTL